MSKPGYKVLAVSAVIAVFVGIATIGAPNVSGRSAEADRPSLDDATIVAIFDAANTYDIETGALAAKKGRDKSVREYGEMLARDHRHVRALGRDLASSLKVTPTPPKDFALARAHAEALRTLKTSAGREFDRAFLEHEVAFHSAVIEAVTTTLLPAISNEQLKDLVTKVAPAFVAHRDKAQSMLSSLK
jgi:putative membrane protein